MPFDLLDHEHPRADRRELLGRRALPAALGSFREAARYFQPAAELVAAVNVALSVGAPLLLTGEPGTGKTQVAHYLAWHFGVEEALFRLDVRSTTTAEDLLYQFDSVAYFHAAHDPARAGAGRQPIDRREFVRKGPLWLALQADGPSIVLLDEIDKAPRDFPNDLLAVLAESRFYAREYDQWIERRAGLAPPLVVITSNSERRLPEPFLRRCIFHHIEFTEDILRRAVAARKADFPGLDGATVEAAIERFMELRQKSVRKKPATAEFLVWLVVLSMQGVGAERLRTGRLGELPALSALIKDRDDLQLL